ncbi:MAG: FCD domain-containing protein [Rhodocyclaceae bacterium]|nr:FCD domain-containing protein [Rhodocyclaceae bacterium]
MSGTRHVTTRVSDEIARQIQTRILEGSFRPGDRLPPERQFSLDLGVSRSTLREAIQKLESRGLLASRQGGGTFVTDKLDADLVDPWLTAVGDQPGLQEDVLEFREMLEAQTAAWAAERATDADLARIGRAYEALEESYRQPPRPAQIEADVAFHQAIAEAAHNLLVGHLSANLLRLMHEHVRKAIGAMQVTPQVADQLTAQHRAILDAIVARDGTAAEAASRRHIAYVRDRTRSAEVEVLRRERALRRPG